MGTAHSTKHLLGDQPQNRPFSGRQGGQVGAARRHGGDDGMVVGHLFTVAYLTGIDLAQRFAGNLGGDGGKLRNLVLHIVRQKTAVGAGIGAELFLIEGLQIVQGLLGGIAQQTVGVPLEGSQIVERRGFLGFLFALHAGHSGRSPFAHLLKPLGTCFFRKAFACGLKAIRGEVHRIERNRRERLDLRLPLDDERQRRRYHAPHIQSAVVEDGKQARGVDAHQPVGAGTAQRRLIERIVFAAGAQVFKALPNGLVLHAGDPQPFHGLGADGEGIDGAEDQLALPPGIAGVDDLGYLIAPHKLPQKVKLPALVLGDGVAPGLGQDGQILAAPFAVLFIVGVSGGKLRQMSETPGNDVSVSDETAVLAPMSAENGCDCLAHRGLFRYDESVQYHSSCLLGREKAAPKDCFSLQIVLELAWRVTYRNNDDRFFGLIHAKDCCIVFYK